MLWRKDKSAKLINFNPHRIPIFIDFHGGEKNLESLRNICYAKSRFQDGFQLPFEAKAKMQPELGSAANCGSVCIHPADTVRVRVGSQMLLLKEGFSMDLNLYGCLDS